MSNHIPTTRRERASESGSSIDWRDRAARKFGRLIPAFVLSLAAVFAVGCGGDSGSNPVVDSTTPPPAGGGTTTPPPAGGGTTTPPPAGGGTTTPPATGGGTTTPPATGGGTVTPSSIVPTWYGVQANILQRYCTVCHSGANPPAGLSWEVGQYAAVVTNARMSTEIPTLREIDPGNPAASYILWKLRGQGPAGQVIQGVRMPAFGAALDPALIAVVEQWISAGAPLGAPADATAGGTTTPPPTGGGTTTPPPTGGGGTTTPPPTGGGTVTPSSIVPTWYGVQANILQRYCTVCHSGANPPAGLSWEVGQYAAIVTNARMSTEIPTLREIGPGNPDASYLMWKLRGQGPAGQAIQGVRMPAFGAALDPALIAVVEQWILSGAPLGAPADATAGGTTTPPPTGGGTTTPPPTGGGGTATPSSIVPTWYGVQANVFQRFCTMCHSGAAAPAGLSWDVDQYAAVVTNRRSSTEIPSMLEVAASNPDASYLMWKLRGQGPAGQAIQGVRMPATGVALDPALIAAVEQWIRDGAPLGTPADATASAPVGPVYPVGSWMYVWTETLQVCTLCHSQTPSSPRCGRDFDCPPKGVVLTADSYARVVNGDEVRPFRLDNSKLWQRVTDSDPAERMPFGMPALSQAQLNIIRDWILNGAPLCPAGATCPP